MIKLETIVDKEKLINDNRRFSKFSSMVVGDKITVDEKKKMGIYVYDPSEMNDENKKKAEILKKLKKYGVQISDDAQQMPTQDRSPDKNYNLAKLMFKSEFLFYFFIFNLRKNIYLIILK